MTPITRQGWVAVGAGVVSIVIARVFGILELFVIGVGFFAAVLVAVAIVIVRRPRLRGGRWIHPMVMVAGDVGRVDIRIEHLGAVPSVSFDLSETVGRPRAAPYTARLPVPPMAGRAFTTTGYELTTTARGIVRLGPLIVEHRDPLGIARTRTLLLDVDEVFVAPRSYLLDMPQLGQGVLGAHLLAMARRLGPGEFHGLREYVDGDEPRSIHWKASARSEQLLVKEHTTEGLRRCTVVLDASTNGYRRSGGVRTRHHRRREPRAQRRPRRADHTVRHGRRHRPARARRGATDAPPPRSVGTVEHPLRDARTRPGRGARPPHRGRRTGRRLRCPRHPRVARSHADRDHRVDRGGVGTFPRRRQRVPIASSSTPGTCCSAAGDSTSRRRARDRARHSRPRTARCGRPEPIIRRSARRHPRGCGLPASDRQSRSRRISWPRAVSCCSRSRSPPVSPACSAAGNSSTISR